MKSPAFYIMVLAPFTALLIWIYTLTRWGDIGTFYAVIFIDVMILAGPILARRRRDRTVLRYSSPLTSDNPLEERTAALARKMGVGSVSIYQADSHHLRRVNALQMGTRRKTVVISDILLQNLLPIEQDAIIAHELAHAKKRHILKRTLASYGYFIVGLNLPLFSGYRSLPFEWSALLIQSGIVLFAVGVVLVIPYLAAQFEVEADSLAARTLGQPEPLVSALVKLVELYPVRRPFSGFWRRTFPSIVERVQRLRAMNEQS